MNASINPELVNNTHYIPFTIYPLTDSSESRLPLNHRLAEVSWRFTEEQKNKGATKRSPVCVALPFILLEVEPICLQEVVQESIENAQDKLIASYINKMIEENTRWNMIGKLVPSELATPRGLSALLAEERSRGRLSKESIGAYFDNYLTEVLLSKLLERNTGYDDTKLAEAARRYRDAICALASPRAMLPVKTATALLKVIDLGADGKVPRALKEKLNAFINPKTEKELVDLL